MYADFFDLKDLPFSITPDPRYLFMSESHREALAHLLYGVKSDGGFVLLTGEVGTGKTTICRCFLEQVPDKTDVAFILNPKLTVEELLATICDELGIRYPDGNSSNKVFIDLINSYLLDANARGRNTVVIIEEAQNLDTDVLEQIRLLTNLETDRRKLLQIVMIGQPELLEILSRPELRQIAQRITARYHLGPISREEIGAYVAHRLSVAGTRKQLFPFATVGILFKLSGGIPRLINLICDRALLGAYVKGKDRVDKPTLVQASREVFGEKSSTGQFSKAPLLALLVLMFLVCGIALAALYFQQNSTHIQTDAQPAVIEDYVAEATPEIAQLADLLWTVDQPIADSKEMAFLALFQQWDIPYSLDGDIPACDQALNYGLNCLHKRESFNALRLLNRPAVLNLFDEHGQEYYATLIELDDKAATVIIGSEFRTVDIKEIARHWFGDYTMLWKMPPHYREEIRPGYQGRVVAWLDKQLAHVQGRKARDIQVSVFDEALVRQAKEFQISEGLVPDGIVGPQTLIHLNTSVGVKVPMLLGKHKDS